LKDGEQVIISGQSHLAQGSKVSIKEVVR
jgi:hypothetical protein